MAKDKGRVCEVINVWCVGRVRGGDWSFDVYEDFEEAARAIKELHPVDRRTVSLLYITLAARVGDELIQIETASNFRMERFIEDPDLEVLKADDYGFDIDEYNKIVEKYGAIELN